MLAIQKTHYESQRRRLLDPSQLRSDSASHAQSQKSDENPVDTVSFHARRLAEWINDHKQGRNLEADDVDSIRLIANSTKHLLANDNRDQHLSKHKLPF